MVRAIFLDLDDTLLWDERCVRCALDDTFSLLIIKYPVIARTLLHDHLKEVVNQYYPLNPMYDYAKRLGINPFEALWGKFEGDIAKYAEEFRLICWQILLERYQINDASFAFELSQFFMMRRRDYHITYPDTFSVLEQLKLKYDLLLLTNGAKDLQQEKIAGLSAQKFSSYFQHIVISEEVGVGKPHPKMFEHALSLFSLTPDQVVMIGDKLSTDIQGASQMGIQSIWINRHQIESYNIKATHEVKTLSEVLNFI